MRVSLGCVLFLAGIGIMTIVVVMVFGALAVLDWAWRLR
jgi:hypothetical protein